MDHAKGFRKISDPVFQHFCPVWKLILYSLLRPNLAFEQQDGKV